MLQDVQRLHVLIGPDPYELEGCRHSHEEIEQLVLQVLLREVIELALFIETVVVPHHPPHAVDEVTEDFHAADTQKVHSFLVLGPTRSVQTHGKLLDQSLQMGRVRAFIADDAHRVLFSDPVLAFQKLSHVGKLTQRPGDQIAGVLAHHAGSMSVGERPVQKQLPNRFQIAPPSMLIA